MNELRHGDQELTDFAREGADGLYSLFRRAVGDAQVAEDLLQDTLHDAWRHIDRYDRERPFRHWVVRIGLNRLRSFLRRRKLERQWVAPLASDPIQEEAGPDGVALTREQTASLEEAVGRLGERQRVAILLRYQQGLSCQEIAEVLDATPNAVSIQLHRAHQASRRMLGDDVSDGDRAR